MACARRRTAAFLLALSGWARAASGDPAIEEWLAAGRAARERGDVHAALRAFGEARRLDPGHAEARQAVARILSGLGGHHGAAALLDPVPFDVRAAQAATAVRWGARLPPSSPARRFEGTDDAIARLQALLAEGRAKGERDSLVPVRGDLAVALRDRRRWNDVLDAVGSLRADGFPVRPYVRRAEADALLALRRPEAALAAYEDVLRADPGDLDARVGLFYAQVESEDFASAFRTADSLDGLDGRVTAAQARHYAGLDAEAWRRIAPIAASVPSLGYVRAAASSIAAARGWPRLAHEEIAIAAALAPEDAGVQAALAASELRRGNGASARARAARLATAFPGDDAVERLAKDIADHDRPEWQVEARGRRESGGASASPGPGTEAVLRAWSSPSADGWRLAAVAETASAKPPEGRAERHRGGLGAQWRLPDATIEAFGWSDGGTLSRRGASFAATIQPADGWTFSLDAERFARDTPLRALLYGITSKGGGVSAGYAWHESRAAWAGWRRGEFSDGNRREQWRVAWAERLVDSAHGTVTLRPEAYASRNTAEGAPYFNPSRDRSLGLGIEADQLLSRRYEASWRHRMGLRLSRYRQQGHPDGWVGGASYEHAWRPHGLLEIRAGIDWGRARYDGAGERVLQAFVSASGRFR